MMNNMFFQTLAQKLPRGILEKLGIPIDKKRQRRQSIKLNNIEELMLRKFEAALLGALAGDCLGEKIEGIWGPNTEEMLSEFKSIKEKYQESTSQQNSNNKRHHSVSFNQPVLKTYTDSIALMLALCDSLAKNGEFDLEDIADSFQLTYYKEPNRGYSNKSVSIFKNFYQLKLSNQLASSCLIPAMNLLNNENFCCNGVGIRSTPIALFTSEMPIDDMKIACELATKLTHNQKWTIIGTLQQCYALRLALENRKSANNFDFDDYYTKIINFVIQMEKDFNVLDDLHMENMETYSKKMQRVLKVYFEQKNKMFNLKKKLTFQNKPSLSVCSNNGSFNGSDNIFNAYLDDSIFGNSVYSNSNHSVSKTNTNNEGQASNRYSSLLIRLNKLIKKCRKGERLTSQMLYKQTTNFDITSIESIPMALFVFMIASDPKCANEVNQKLSAKNSYKHYHPIERVIFYAISFGGESHKLASMAGALAGAFFSSKDMPHYLYEMCESHNDVLVYAQKLFEISFNKALEESSSSEISQEIKANETIGPLNVN